MPHAETNIRGIRLMRRRCSRALAAGLVPTSPPKKRPGRRSSISGRIRRRSCRAGSEKRPDDDAVFLISDFLPRATGRWSESREFGTTPKKIGSNFDITGPNEKAPDFSGAFFGVL